MVSPVMRRRTPPKVVQQVWTSINFVRSQKQIANTERIMRYMHRTFGFTQSDARLQLQTAVSDGLVERYTLVGSKGAKTGVEQEGFKIPEPHDDVNRGDHDWYCFECHRPGDVVECSGCWRVYHPACAEAEGATFLCVSCEELEVKGEHFIKSVVVCTDLSGKEPHRQESKKKQRIKRKELNRLLSYTINHLKEKVRPDLTIDLKKMFTSTEEQRLKRFVYLHVDLSKMEAKTKNRKYRYLEQFEGDAQTIYHNILICYGEGNMASLAKTMVRDCKYDVDEIRQCKDCYHYSNAKPRDWFCQPCRPPHELVYAKQKGFSYWPAKVIKVTKEGYDVRFFGGWHQRAVVVNANVKPIETTLHQLNMKKVAVGFNKACDEMKRHQKILAKQAVEDESDMSATEMKDEPEEEDEEEEGEVEPPSLEEEERHEEEPRKEEALEPPKPKKARRHKVHDAEAITSSNTFLDKSAPTPEDANLVTSSEDNVQTPRVISSVDIGVQTSRKLSHPGRHPHKSTQTEVDTSCPAPPGTCKCDVTYNKMFTDYKERLHSERQDDKDRDLQQITEKMRKDSEEEKEQAVASAVSNTQLEVEHARRQTEEHVKEQYMEELKKLALKHKTEISQTKKKQWCYNCEEEAMYHCCWNTSYCSTNCQQEHWHQEHKRCCRRKRPQ